MHPIQKKILELGQTHDLGALGLRQIGRMVGEPHPQKIKHHLKQLNLLSFSDGSKSATTKTKELISVPLIGLANCGPEAIFAEARPEGHLQVSKKMINGNSKNLFAVQAIGNSMNKANINGKSIEDGDYVIIDGTVGNFKTGDYVLSVINNLTNIKKLIRDELNHQIVLVSESIENFPPIFIHQSDFGNYLVNGKVIAVLKRPKEAAQDVVFEKVLE